MRAALALLVEALRWARFVALALYLLVAAGYLYADPRSGWSWFIVIAGGLICGLLWWLVAAPERRTGLDHD